LVIRYFVISENVDISFTLEHHRASDQQGVI